jgi:hypothetical protein
MTTEVIPCDPGFKDFTLTEPAHVQVTWNDKVIYDEQLPAGLVGDIMLIGRIPTGEAGVARMVIDGEEFPCTITLTEGWVPVGNGQTRSRWWNRLRCRE